ncbi:MAG: CinA family protein [Sinimarinibacterium sp.]|jgi:nicotinamide-nucleotide amidase
MYARVVEIAERLQARGEWLAVAESCTGGLIAKSLTDLAGSSAWFERGVVSYSNRAKQELLGVAPAVLEHHGAVSEATVLAMAGGVLAHAPVQWSVAVTGIAGPGGGNADKPVGTVWIAAAQRDGTATAHGFRFDGDRESVRAQAARMALDILLDRLRRAAA